MLRCRICGETYLGIEPPSRCPFCGALTDYFVGPGIYTSSENAIQPTEIEREDLEQAIELERANTRFYLAMSQMSGDEALASAYKRLAKIEAEHCSVFCKLLDVSKPSDLGVPDEMPTSWCEAIEESAKRERRASEFYAQVVERATSPRLKEVFSAVSAVEFDHLAFDGLAAEWAGCDED